jgi:hypothetical protein
MLKRLLVTAMAFVVYGIAQMVFNPLATIISGDVAGHQFDNSDISYIGTMATFSILNGIGGFISLGLIVALVIIWASPVVNLFKHVNSEGSDA